jgi:DNA-binding GntR family transcriptional regulator
MAESERTSRPLTRSEWAYQTLRQRILDGELEPGERLLLRPLAEQLGLSVMPVRDAVRLLERDGLVQVESYRGAIVTPIAAETVVELVGVRMWLEALAMREAAPLHDAESLALVHQRLDECEALVDGEPLAFSRANRALHVAMAAPAPRELNTMIQDTWDRGWQARRHGILYGLVPERSRAAQPEHRAIVAALDRHDAEGACAAMLAHREGSLAAWRRGLGYAAPRDEYAE